MAGLAGTTARQRELRGTQTRSLRLDEASILELSQARAEDAAGKMDASAIKIQSVARGRSTRRKSVAQALSDGITNVRLSIFSPGANGAAPKPPKRFISVQEQKRHDAVEVWMMNKHKKDEHPRWFDVPPSLKLMNNWKVEMHYHKVKSAGHVTLRDKMYRFLGNPVSSKPATAFSAFILILSFFSIITFGVENSEHVAIVRAWQAEGWVPGNDATPPPEVPEWDTEILDRWYAWNCFCAGIFTLELLLRVLTYQKPWADYILWIDLMALLPLLVRVFLKFHTGMYATAMELFEFTSDHGVGGVAYYLNAAGVSLRLFKMTRYMLGMQILKETISDAYTSLFIPSFLLFMMCCLLGTILFAVEYDFEDPDNGSRVPDVTTAWWMVLVTMTTVGYGDYSPQTGVGSVIMSVVMVIGLVLVAMPLAIVGEVFSEAWSSRTIKLIGEAVKKDLLNKGLGVRDVIQAFDEFDDKCSGVMTYPDFKRAVTRKLGMRLSRKKLRAAWGMLDLDESGEVSYVEFAQAIFPELDEEDLISMLHKSLDKDHSRDANATTVSADATDADTADADTATAEVGQAEAVAEVAPSAVSFETMDKTRLDKLETAVGQLNTKLDAVLARLDKAAEARAHSN
jgi:hypothetical protein